VAPFDEPHTPAGCMSYPPIDAPDFAATTPNASVHVCDAAHCQAMASMWVARTTGHPGVFRPFPTRKD
jgi:hypothetical protein